MQGEEGCWEDTGCQRACEGQASEFRFNGSALCMRTGSGLPFGNDIGRSGYGV